MMGNGLKPKDEEIYSTYKMPAVTRDEEEIIPIKESMLIAALLHPATVFAIAILMLIISAMGINIQAWKAPQPKMQDIEFVFNNNPEQDPINKNTKFRSDKNSRAGGQHDPNRKISQPEPNSAAQKASVPTPKSPAPAKKQAPAPKVQNNLKKIFEAPKPKVETPKQQPPKVVEKTVPTPQPVAPKVTKSVAPKVAPPKATPPKFATEKPTLNIPKSIGMPVPSTSKPKAIGSSTGPVTSVPSSIAQGNSSGSASGGSSGSQPSPVLSSGYGTRGSNGSTGSMGARGTSGNPGPGNPNGAPGVDAIKAPDFGPYMRELQRRIKANWEPPRGDESKRVVLLFKIARDGRLLNLKVLKSSGSPAADKAALSAVELTAPFRSLPIEFRGSDIDIQFTFDYNVFGVGGGRY